MRRNKRKRANVLISYNDFQNALTVLIFVIFICAFMLIAPKKPDQDPGAKLIALYLVTIEWDQAHDGDVDLWVQDPDKNVAYFQHMETSIVHLDHDSRGSATDGQTRAVTGLASDPASYEEVVSVRRAVAGVYTVNVHLYAAHRNGITYPSGHGDPYEVPIRVKVVKLNPKYEEKFNKVVTIHKIWEEQTALQFTLNDDGNFIGFSDDKQIRLFDDAVAAEEPNSSLTRGRF